MKRDPLDKIAAHLTHLKCMLAVSIAINLIHIALLAKILGA